MIPMPRVSAVLAAAGLLLLTVVACVAPEHKQEPPAAASEFSQLTKAGIARIEKTRHARFDLRNHELTKAAVGLEGESMGPIIGGARKPMITLELLAPNRTETVETNTMGFVSTGTEPYGEIVFFRPLDTPEQANTELREGITRWGFNADNVRQWEENTRDKADDQLVVSMGIGPSGLVVSVEAYLKKGKALLRYMVHLEPYLYAPQALDDIRRTGITRYRG